MKSGELLVVPVLGRAAARLVDDPDVTIVYISHHQDEIDSLGFENILQL